VIVDTAPVLPVADALALSRVVHGVLVVAQANRVSKKDIGETLSRLERVGAPVFGIVLNRASNAAGGGGTYGYGYNYSPVEEPTPAATDGGESTVDRANLADRG
jgi:Mrp family chromosome partitioning ATPase